MNVIEQKCKKAYPSFFSLVVFARSGRVLSTEAVAETLRSINVPFSEIWIIGLLDAHPKRTPKFIL
jgi:hypothetical protein